MRPLKIGISGVRGIVGETLTPELIVDFACAFATFVESGTVLMARDTRPSGRMLSPAVRSAVVSCGSDVVDLGVCPTPVLQYETRNTDAAGAISITASHNRAEWNALKFINDEGVTLSFEEAEEVLDIYHQGDFARAAWDKLGKLELARGAEERYLDALVACLDHAAIAAASLKVVVDLCNGAGCDIVKRLMGRLGVETILINDEPTGLFAHDPEPNPANMEQVAAIMEPLEANVGFVLSSDGDRVGVVTEKGEPLSEEFTLLLVAEHLLSEQTGRVVTNLSTTAALDDIVRKYGGEFIRTRVGQGHVVRKMLQEDAVLAGEGSGGIAIPGFQPAFDAFAALGSILEMLAKRRQTVSAIVETFPDYTMVKQKLECPPEISYAVVEEVAGGFDREALDVTDGIRYADDDGWVHVRSSATEPLIRIIAESRSADKAHDLADKARRLALGAMRAYQA